MWTVKRALEAGYELNIKQTEEGLFVRVRLNDAECARVIGDAELKYMIVDEPHRRLIDECIKRLEEDEQST